MPIYIVATIIVILIALACYAFITQTIEKKNLQKQRLLMTLKTKHRNFVHMLNGFPPQFLPNDLLGLVYRELIETCEQLRSIEPHEPKHADEITLLTNQLSALAKNSSAQRARIDNPQQMKDVRQHLQELLHFVAQQEASKAINKVQSAAFQDQIKRLALQMSVDAYIYQAKQAQQTGKVRLAIHFFTLAKKLLTTENAAHSYDKQIAQIDGIIQKLEEKAKDSGEAPSATEAAAPLANKEWDKFTAPQPDQWKKKNIYD